MLIRILLHSMFCALQIHKPDGMVLLGSITKLETNPVKDTTFPLQVHFSGKPVTGNSSSPWVLDLLTNVSVGMSDLKCSISFMISSKHKLGLILPKQVL